MVVEADAGSEAEKALQYPFLETGQGAGTVVLQGEQILAGREDGFDTLARRSEVRALSGLIPAFRADHGSFQLLDGRGELSARIALVTKQDLPSFSWAAAEQFQADLSFIALGRRELKSLGVPSRAKMACSRMP